jgi:hypothetical protein
MPSFPHLTHLIERIPLYHALPHGCWCAAHVAWRVSDGDGLTDGPLQVDYQFCPLVFCNVYYHLMETRRDRDEMTWHLCEGWRDNHDRQCSLLRIPPKSSSRQYQFLMASSEENPQLKRDMSPTLHVSLMNAVRRHHFSQK